MVPSEICPPADVGARDRKRRQLLRLSRPLLTKRANVIILSANRCRSGNARPRFKCRKFAMMYRVHFATNLQCEMTRVRINATRQPTDSHTIVHHRAILAHDTSRSILATLAHIAKVRTNIA